MAALTVYDMCKALGSQHMVISDICVLDKKGGKSDISRTRNDI